MLTLTHEQTLALHRLIDVDTFKLDSAAILAKIASTLEAYAAGKLTADWAVATIENTIETALSVDARFFNHSECKYQIELDMLSHHAHQLPEHLRTHPQAAFARLQRDADALTSRLTTPTE